MLFSAHQRLTEKDAMKMYSSEGEAHDDLDSQQNRICLQLEIVIKNGGC